MQTAVACVTAAAAIRMRAKIVKIAQLTSVAVHVQPPDRLQQCLLMRYASMCGPDLSMR